MERTRSLIVTAWKAWWDALAPAPGFVLVYDGLKGKPAAGIAWARLTVVQGNNWSPYVGQPRGRRRCVGFLTLQVFSPEDSGVKPVSTLADTVADFWDAKELSGTAGSVQTHVIFRNTSLLIIGAKDGYQQHNVTAEFQRDTIRP